MHGPQGVMKAGMQRAGVYQVRHAQLFDIAQPLKIRVLYQIEYQLRGDTDESVYRIVYDLLFVQFKFCGAKMLN